MDILYLDVDALKDQKAFEEKLGEMSTQRKAKILAYQSDADKRLSLGAGMLLDEILKKMGYREGNLEYFVNEQGKPYYKQLPEFHFSLSHSGHYAVATSSNREIGIDIEEKKQNKMRLKVANRFFHPEEYERLKNTKDRQEQTELFYRIWTMKESFVKAAGMGMNLAFESFCVLEAIEKGEISTEQMGKVQVQSFDKIEGYQLSVCSKNCEKARLLSYLW